MVTHGALEPTKAWKLGLMPGSACSVPQLRCKEQNGAILVAELQNKVIGFVAIQSEVSSTDLDEPPGNHGLISDLAVTEHYRGRGLGRTLMAAADAFARQHGAADVRIGALCANESAEALYRALGFRPYCRSSANAANGQERNWDTNAELAA